MPRQKRGSLALTKAERRSAGLRAISAKLDLGEGLTLENYFLLIENLRSQLATYNESLSFIDRAVSSIQDTEKQLKDLSERMLIAVAAKYGKDSYEYEMAGGIRKSERKRPVRKASAAAQISEA